MRNCFMDLGIRFHPQGPIVGLEVAKSKLFPSDPAMVLLGNFGVPRLKRLCSSP